MVIKERQVFILKMCNEEGNEGTQKNCKYNFKNEANLSAIETSSVTNSAQRIVYVTSDTKRLVIIRENQGNQEVYSSSLKIKLQPGVREEKVSKETDIPVTAPVRSSSTEVMSHYRPDFSKVNMAMTTNVRPTSRSNNNTQVQRSQKSYGSTRMDQKTNVREVIMPSVKVHEKVQPPSPDDNKPEKPAHSTVDEGDFAGVVDGPTKNVKEIRAMFKNGPDYANYAKPKLVPVKPKPGHTYFPEEGSLEKVKRDPPVSPGRPDSGPSHEVAQQVIGLFKDALTIDDKTQVVTTPASEPHPVENGSHDNGPHISVKDKVASFNVGKSPVVEKEVNNNVTNEVTEMPKPALKEEIKPTATYTPYAEIISNPAPKTNIKDTLASVQQEKVNAGSYDESLDQFYDVLEELTAS